MAAYEQSRRPPADRLLSRTANIAFGKLAQALEYGAKTIQVEANFDQILALCAVSPNASAIYLLNSINPFRIEGKRPSWPRCWTSSIGKRPTGWCCPAVIWGTRRPSARGCAS